MQDQRDQLPRYTPPRKRLDLGNVPVMVMFLLALGLIALLGLVWLVLALIF